MENGGQGDGKDPSSFLGDIIGNPVTVKLNSGVVYKGEPSRIFRLSQGLKNIASEAWVIPALTPNQANSSLWTAT